MENRKISQFDTITTVEDTDIIAGVRASDNIKPTALQIAEYANLHNFTALSFDNTDLTAFTLTVTHNKNSRQVDVWYYDNNWVKQSLDGLLTLSSVNAFSINFGMDITGTHTIYYKFF